MNQPKPLRLKTPPIAVVTPTTVTTNIVEPSSVVIVEPTRPTAVTYKPFSMDDVSVMGQVQQKAIAAVTDKITGIAKTSEMDEVGAMLGNLLVTAKGYDPESGSKFNLFSMLKSKAQQIRNRFDTVDSSVAQLVAQIDSKIVLFKRRVVDLDTVEKANMVYHGELGKTITENLARVEWMEANPPPASTDPIEAKNRATWLQVAAYARKRIDDMRRAQVLAEMQDSQIGLMKTNSSALAMKFSDLKDTTIPALKQTFTLYIINLEAAKGAKFATVVDDVTNAVMQKNAQQLGANTTAIHTALNRSSIDLTTLQMNHKAVLDSISEIERISSETKTRLAAESPQIESLSRELAARLSA